MELLGVEDCTDPIGWILFCQCFGLGSFRDVTALRIISSQDDVSLTERPKSLFINPEFLDMFDQIFLGSIDQPHLSFSLFIDLLRHHRCRFENDNAQPSIGPIDGPIDTVDTGTP